MIVTDPIADILTRIRNGLIAKKTEVKVPTSKLKVEILKILVEEGYIKSYEIIPEHPQDNITITLKYGKNNAKVINGLKRISKPGLRVFAGKDDLPKVLNGLGIAIVSTNKGIMTDRQARQASVGGEVLAYIW